MVWWYSIMLLLVLSPPLYVSTHLHPLKMYHDQSSSCPVYTNGCSVPGNLPVPYKVKFTPACHKHDVCYSCGQYYSWKKYACDITFRDDMYYLCNSSQDKRFVGRIWNWLKKVVSKKVERCRSMADVFYKTVDIFGQRYYPTTSPAWCRKPCVGILGDPSRRINQSTRN